MPRFFQDFSGGDTARITGQDAIHIHRALRMREGDTLILCDGRGTDYTCAITAFEGEDVILAVQSVSPSCGEPTLAVTLYQGLPKSDKMEWIIQKGVELGVHRVVPVVTSRSIVRPDGGKGDKKRVRWQKIADEAAGQCGRGILPAVSAPLSWAEALEDLQKRAVPAIVFYEGGGQPLKELFVPGQKEAAVFIGPEGGFAPEEIRQLEALGVKTATLGPRILRCETAPLAALSALMLLSGNLD